MAKLTRAEFYEKYGDVEVVFDSYYKYTFNFHGLTKNGSTLTVRLGGDADEIYREEIYANDVTTVQRLQPYAGTVYDASGNEVDSFYDY